MPGEPPVAASAFFSATSVPVAREFDYDDANRMHAVRQDGVVAMRYLYNAMGERVHRAGSGIAVATLYDEDGKWIGDYDANGQPIQQVVWLDDLPVGLLVGAGANQKLYYIEADALGTPRVVIDPTRNVAVWRWNLADEAFGDSAPNQDVDGDGTAFVFDMRFPGQRYDSATGLNYNYFRDYDPGTGRYAQSDPIGLGGGMTTYGYAEGSPLVYSDPEGLAAAFILRMGIRYFAPRLAAGAIKRMTPRLVRNEIKRVAKRSPKTPQGCNIALKAPIHHICTNKNCVSLVRGGPWTPRFEAIFQKAGINLDDALNKIAVPGHKGPHPQAYHQAVFRRLESATSGLNGGAYRHALRTEMQAIRGELQNPRSLLNQLVRKP